MAFGGRMFGTMLVVGVGVLTVAAIVAAPTILRRARPLVREGMLRGMEFYGKARAAATELTEDFEDLIAEVRSEIVAKQSPETPAPPADKVA